LILAFGKWLKTPTWTRDLQIVEHLQLAKIEVSDALAGINQLLDRAS